MDDIRRQLHNEQVIAELKSVEEEAKSFKRDIDGIAHAAQTESQKLGADSGHPQSSNDEALKVAKET